jgi:hypothetical protein
MKASELYDIQSKQADALQKVLRNSIHDQMVTNQSLENVQMKMKSLMQTVIKEGDRELTETELKELGLL